MSQNDLEIANATANTARLDISGALQAVASNNSGTSEPSTTYANMYWYDTTSNAGGLLKIRNYNNTGWVNVGYIDQSDGLEIINDTKVVNTTGTQTGLIGEYATATWEAGTTLIDSLVSPAKVKAAILANDNSVGVGQTWQDMSSSRVINTSYRNTTGRPILVSVGITSSVTTYLQVSTDNISWLTVGNLGGFGNIGDTKSACVVIPDDDYYKATAGTINMWAELR
jgi:hypothetical protein